MDLPWLRRGTRKSIHGMLEVWQRVFILIVINVFRFLPAYSTGLPFPSEPYPNAVKLGNCFIHSAIVIASSDSPPYEGGKFKEGVCLTEGGMVDCQSRQDVIQPGE